MGKIKVPPNDWDEGFSNEDDYIEDDLELVNDEGILDDDPNFDELDQYNK